ncbi:hypothetical protein Psta_3317 [Pirellula staleyi DSM 6068]|uniref:Uncharacterized protein n=1 Tax=Pirellula staleyi (strain ATCC 27377 / DSM 6068 / ICPB 4128) TaxID=530564 RepID=D2QXE1_PIRSD|nr:hypothetical protein Psta_3317 [Pirellula staleyi DSM 6068]
MQGVNLKQLDKVVRSVKFCDAHFRKRSYPTENAALPVDCRDLQNHSASCPQCWVNETTKFAITSLLHLPAANRVIRSEHVAVRRHLSWQPRRVSVSHVFHSLN